MVSDANVRVLNYIYYNPLSSMHLIAKRNFTDTPNIKVIVVNDKLETAWQGARLGDTL